MRGIRGAIPGQRIAVPPALHARFLPGAVVASYMPIAGEIDPAPLVEAALAAGCRLALPYVVDRPTPIRFLSAEGPLVPGPFGLTQPHAEAQPLAPDVILAPLVAFDRGGNRLGWGAGHYDRAFAEHPHAWRVGVAWSVQEVDALTPDPWDVPLHAIATEKEWIEP
jgi:5-formyltetrahydrofolate cyclo-ligase